MAERVHPSETASFRASAEESAAGKSEAAPPAGTYVIQIPKDQVYRVPPPENAKRYELLTRRKASRGSGCRRCFCCALSVVLSLILILAVAAGVFYFVVRPKAPRYSIESFSVSGLNLSLAGPVSPAFDVAVKADNPNKKLGIDYRGGSSVGVFYDGERLAAGKIPTFYQGSKNVTVFSVPMTGSGINLTSSVRSELVSAQSRGAVPFQVKVRAPVKLKVGAVKTWTFTVKVDCDVTVDKLTKDSKIVSKDCDYGVDLW